MTTECKWQTAWRELETYLRDNNLEGFLDTFEEIEEKHGVNNPEAPTYRDDRNYRKCKWERSWGEFNASLHATRDATALTGEEIIDDLFETFDNIAAQNNVETFEECWDGEVEECEEHK